ncbi:hypothetical protein BpHYR1_016981 [Brachionus plicatilis]|uniref:Uncharacterized protein n=1 Tax=Brachionus plicatilis TaxID=10195 RepID=A0A3M7Q775_BRAPC|nr:hypothetical protein BpHYR1_016981 [Brachionus plicatilis]
MSNKLLYLISFYSKQINESGHSNAVCKLIKLQTTSKGLPVVCCLMLHLFNDKSGLRLILFGLSFLFSLPSSSPLHSLLYIHLSRHFTDHQLIKIVLVTNVGDPKNPGIGNFKG